MLKRSYICWQVFVTCIVLHGMASSVLAKQSVYVSSYASLTAAVAATGSVTPTDLYVDVSTSCTANTIVTPNIKLITMSDTTINHGTNNLTINGATVHEGSITGSGALTTTGIFSANGGTIATSGSISINGPFSAAPYQVFSQGSGVVTGLSFVKASWFGNGNVQAAANAAVGGMLEIDVTPNGYDITSTLVLPTPIKVIGKGTLNAKLNNSNVIQLKTDSSIEDLTIASVDGYAGNTGIALLGGSAVTTNVNSTNIRSVHINGGMGGITTGILIEGGCNENRIEKNSISVQGLGSIGIYIHADNTTYTPSLNFIYENNVLQAETGIYANGASSTIYDISVERNNFYNTPTSNGKNSIYYNNVSGGDIVRNWFEGTLVKVNNCYDLYLRGKFAGAGYIGTQVLPAYGIDLEGTNYNIVIDNPIVGYNATADIHQSSSTINTKIMGGYRAVGEPSGPWATRTWAQSIINDAGGQLTVFVSDSTGYLTSKATTTSGYSGIRFVNNSNSITSDIYSDGNNLFLNPTSGLFVGNGTTSKPLITGRISIGTSTFANLGWPGQAGLMLFCIDCQTSATCASGGTGHLAVANGMSWTCQ